MCRCRCRCMCLRDCMCARVLTCTRAKQATSGARSYRPKKARVESSCADRCRMFVPPFLRTETCAVALGTLPLRLCVGRCHGEMKPKGVRRPKPSHARCRGGCGRVWLNDAATAAGSAKQHRDPHRPHTYHNTFSDCARDLFANCVGWPSPARSAAQSHSVPDAQRPPRPPCKE
jgi:hypothetical protein